MDLRFKFSYVQVPIVTRQRPANKGLLPIVAGPRPVNKGLLRKVNRAIPITTVPKGNMVISGEALYHAITYIRA